MSALKDGYGFYRDWVFLAAFGVAVALLFLVAAGFSAVWTKAECDTIGRTTGHDTRWELIGGCFVEVDGEWVPLQRWMVNSGN